MKNIYAVLLLLNITLAYSQEPSFISHISQKLVKNVGDDVEMACSTKHSQEFYASWVKVAKDPIDASIVLSFGSTLIVKDPRVSLTTEIKQDNSRYIIHIHDIQEDDASIYRCDVITGINDKISYYTQLLVANQPLVYENSSRSLVVVERQSVQLACFAGEYPTARVFWRKPNSAILSMGNILNIPAIKKEDRGDYHCMAENGVERRISISVQFPPVVTALRTPVGQAVNYDTYLGCRITGNPTPAMSWIFNGVELSNNQHFLMIKETFHPDSDTTDFFLQITQINRYLYGGYNCTALNIFGAAEATVTLYETPLPQ